MTSFVRRCHALPAVVLAAGIIGCSGSSPSVPSGTGSSQGGAPRSATGASPADITKASSNRQPLGVGATQPEFQAAGWINGPAPAASDLAGKVVVIDVWAHW